MDKLKALRTNDALNVINENRLNELSKEALEKKYGRNEVLFEEGEKSHYVFVLVSGLVKCVKRAFDGRNITVELYFPGDLIGEFFCLSGASYTFSAETVSEASVLAIRKDRFISAVSENPSLGERIMSIASRRLIISYNKLAETVSEKIEQRLARAFLYLSARTGAEIPLIGTELAGLVGSTLETTYRVTSSMRDLGIIKNTRGKVKIIDIAKLRLLAEGMPVNVKHQVSNKKQHKAEPVGYAMLKESYA
jgi:CRP-like cAMP-binding protein